MENPGMHHFPPLPLVPESSKGAQRRCAAASEPDKEKQALDLIFSELDQFIKVNEEVISVRVKVQQRRKALSRARDYVAECDTKLMDKLRQSQLDQAHLDSDTIAPFFEACQKARDQFGPLEDEFEKADFQLVPKEFDLTRRYEAIKQKYADARGLNSSSDADDSTSEDEDESVGNLISSKVHNSPDGQQALARRTSKARRVMKSSNSSSATSSRHFDSQGNQKCLQPTSPRSLWPTDHIDMEKASDPGGISTDPQRTRSDSHPDQTQQAAATKTPMVSAQVNDRTERGFVQTVSELYDPWLEQVWPSLATISSPYQVRDTIDEDLQATRSSGTDSPETGEDLLLHADVRTRILYGRPNAISDTAQGRVNLWLLHNLRCSRWEIRRLRDIVVAETKYVRFWTNTALQWWEYDESATAQIDIASTRMSRTETESVRRKTESVGS